MCYVPEWQTLYPTSQTMNNVLLGTGAECQTCHEMPTGAIGWNPYGQQIRTFILGGQSPMNAIMAAEPFDSDSDPTGSSNISEIMADTQPGWTPGLNNTIFGQFNSTPNQPPPAGIMGSLDPGAFPSFCTAKTMTICGPASISGSGTPSATTMSGFVVSAGPTRGCRAGLLLYSNQPVVPGVTFGGPGDGLLCLFPGGLRRAGPIDAGGTAPNVCDGVMAIDMNQFRALMWAAMGCNPAPGQNNPAGFLGNPGVMVSGQFWYRDSVGTGQGLSDGLMWAVGP
jgi:hypothetical protein